MKYKKLTKEQFQDLHHEFSIFLATQKIDSKEWSKIKVENSLLVEEELALFSDFVWDDVLTRTEYLEHFSDKTINLFKCTNEALELISVKVTKNINLREKSGYQWFINNLKDPTVEIFTAKKTYKGERNREIFDLIVKGATISKGELFCSLSKIING